MKNRRDTISGGSGNAVLKKLEDVAKLDKNRTSPYCCVVAYGMDTMLHRGRKKDFANIEVWPSNFVWPFVSGHTYAEIVSLISENLKNSGELPSLPQEIIQEFKKECLKHKLIDANGIFNDKDKIIECFCN